MTLLLSLAYVLPLALLVLIWSSRRPRRRWKLLLSSLLPFLYLWHWIGLKQIEGWPSNQALPDQFELISADVVEPNPAKNLSGSIHLWLRHQEQERPRAYRLEYSRALHKSLHETRQRIAQGQQQMGLLYEEKTSGKGVVIGQGKRLDFQNAPRRRLPPKLPPDKQNR